ncbi:MAG TPA: hypothetical protein VNM40_02145 [Candidatus Paceibacterota bacterium]|nr:hypothetical protein [Candidatus Paceibacterota bacterium]
MNSDWRNGLIALAVLVVGIGGFFVYQNFFSGETPQENGEVAGETEDFSNTPDGTPESIDVRLNETQSVLGVRVNPVEVVEDSRCPADVECIQAGTVRVRALVTGRGQAEASEIMFELDTPMTVGDDTVTLIAVSPEPQSEGTISPENYLFTFMVVKGGALVEFNKG